MSELSRLEKDELAKLYRLLASINSSRNKVGDSVNDFIFRQVDLSGLDNEDKLIVEMVQQHFELADKSATDAFAIAERLAEHFRC